MAEYAVSGAVGGLCLVIASYPLDSIKCLIQNQSSHRRSILGLYRGISAPLAATPPIAALVFGTYGLGLNLFNDHILAAGAFSGLLSAFAIGPAERVKVLLQTSTNPNPFDILKKVYTGGIRSIFRGTMITIARDTIGSALYFGIYEHLKHEHSTLTAGGTCPQYSNP